jgi:predicted metal-dependent peptidase
MPDDDIGKLVSPGTGGTAFSPIFQFLEDNDINPVATVVLTDLCCDDFGPAPSYPTLWVSNYADKAPWGEVVKM